jgi:protein-tyrosine phosphatase
MTVCTGNICRSPMAQIVLAERLAQAGVDAIVDSTGVSDEEAGNAIDPRAQRVLRDAGYAIPRHRARQAQPGDLAARDLVLAMTYHHWRVLGHLANRVAAAPELRMLREFDPAATGTPSAALDIQDPWYGGPDDFRRSLRQIEAAAPGVVAWAAHARTAGR